MSNSQIALENKFKYLLEKFGYISVAFVQGKTELPQIYINEIDNLLISINDRISKTSDKDKKTELTDLYNVCSKLKLIANQILNLSDLIPTLPISKLVTKIGSPPNIPIEMPQKSPRFQSI